MMARIAFLGDTLLGGSAQDVIDEHGATYPFAAIRHLWESADLVVANHEGPLTDLQEPAPKLATGRKRYWYKGTPDSAHTLAAQGINVVSLANNHVGDYGPQGVIDTMGAMSAAGIAHCGAGRNDNEARRPVIISVNGLRIGFLSVMQRYQMYLDEDVYARPGHPGPALLKMSRLEADFARLRPQVDLTVVLVHWGRNYRPATSLQERLAPQMVAAGAELVIGHHPHVPHPVRLVDGIPVLFSLGNAVFGTPGRYRSGRLPYGLVATVEVEPHRVTGIQLSPIHVDNTVVGYQPQPVSDETGGLVVARLTSALGCAPEGSGTGVSQSRLESPVSDGSSTSSSGPAE